MTTPVDGPKTKASTPPSSEPNPASNDMLRGIELAMEAGDMFWDALGDEGAPLLQEAAEADWNEDDKPPWEEDQGELTRTTTLSALSAGSLAASELPADEGLRRSGARPLNEQNYRRLSSTYFEDIANVEATDEVPTWDVRPEAPTTTLRGAFGGEDTEYSMATPNAEVDSWWEAQKAAHEAETQAGGFGEPVLQEDDEDDEAFCVEYTDEVPAIAPEDPDYETYAAPEPEAPPAPAQATPAAAPPKAATPPKKLNLVVVAGVAAVVVGGLIGIVMVFVIG